MKLICTSWFIILFSLFSLPAIAQQAIKHGVPQMDSVQHLMDSHAKEDEEMVRLMNEYARLCFYNLKLKEGLIATREARDLAKKLDFEGGKIMYYQTLALFQGNNPMFGYYQRHAFWLSRQKDKQLGKYFEELQVINYDIGNDFQRLLDQFSSMLQHFEKLDDKEIQASLLWPMIYFNFSMGKVEQGLILEDRIIALYTDLNQMYPVFLGMSYKMIDLNSLGRVDEAKKLEKELVELVSQNENEEIFGPITSTMATGYANSGRYGLAIEYYLKSLEAFKRTNDLEMEVQTYYQMGVAYENLEMNSKAAESYASHISLLENLNDSSNLFLAYNYIVSPLIALKKYDEAEKYMTLSLHDTITENRIYVLARYHDAKGQITKNRGNYADAIPYFKKAFDEFVQTGNSRWALPFMPLYLSECYLKIGDINSALQYALQCLELETALNSNNTVVKSKVSLLLSEIYEYQGNQPVAYKYLKMHQQIRAETDKLDEANRIADAEVRSILDRSQKEINQLEKEKILKEQETKTQRLWIFSMSGAFISAIVLSLVLYRNNQNKQKANALLQEQKEEIQSTLEKLESTQSQLIQSEKMSSLGELTAGIAHEIQNPLNFVNNFSELNTELIDELKKELAVGSKEWAVGSRQLAQELIADIKTNEQKINHHGKRAEGIVKGMLQHSRSSSGVKEPTDVNALADEYLRLAYHGLRAKDKTFNAVMKTDFDGSIGSINIVPQDIGRVILNLITNAFYAVTEKSKLRLRGLPAGLAGYEPTVSVSTRKEHNKILISVKDNGNGIPQKVLDKIFQPFFTTKPTGQGTGLGLSMSYDIVKAHGGELNVDTKEEEGSVFIIELTA